MNDQLDDLIHNFEQPENLFKMENVILEKKSIDSLFDAKYGDKLYQTLMIKTVKVDDGDINLYDKEFDKNNKEILMKITKEYVDGLPTFLAKENNRFEVDDLKITNPRFHKNIIKQQSMKVPLLEDVGDSQPPVEQESFGSGLLSWLHSIPIIGNYISDGNPVGKYGIRIIGGISSFRFTPVKFNLRTGNLASSGGGILDLFQ